MTSKAILFASYVLALLFVLVVMTSHPQAADVLGRWFSWYLPMAGALALPLGYVVYRGLIAAIGD